MSEREEPQSIIERKLLDIASALDIVLSEVSALSPEQVSLQDAAGRYIAHPAVSQVDLPGFDNSVMDGYAVRATDTADAERVPVVLEVSGESRAGEPCECEVTPGKAVAISTGALIPGGADSVIQKELVQDDGTRVTVKNKVEPGRDIRWRGEVVKAGEMTVDAGTRLGAVELGALASIGLDQVSCHRPPTVDLLTNGDELASPGVPLRRGQIWDSNRYSISTLINESHGVQRGFESVPDSRKVTMEALERSLSADLTVICGGVSVGEHDHVRPSLEELGVEQLFWGLALKPGRPTWFGRRGKSRVLGLPGNPVSALVVFRLLAMPLLQLLAGGPVPAPRRTARLESPVDRLPLRMRAVPCRPKSRDRPNVLNPMPQLGSHDFLSLLGATHLALVEAGKGRTEVGEIVETVPLGGV